MNNKKFNETLEHNLFKTKEKYFKEAYLNLGQIEGGYTFAQIQALRNMAEMDIYPDGRFSDEECNVWSMFHCFHKKD